jgi:hypothetical protein
LRWNLINFFAWAGLDLCLLSRWDDRCEPSFLACIISYNCVYIYNDLKIKSFEKIKLPSMERGFTNCLHLPPTVVQG